jgi:hypothetical protein
MIEDDFDTDDKQGFDPQGSFENEPLIARLQFIVSYYRAPILEHLTSAPLSGQARRSVKNAINELFDPNTVLTHLRDNIDIRILDARARLILNEVYTEFDAVDALQREWPPMETEILDYYNKLLLRAFGPDRERRQQNKNEFSSEITKRLTPVEEPQKRRFSR